MGHLCFEFVVATLACWRITRLLAKEDGPFNFVYIIRKKAGAGFFGSLLDCFYCTSVWVSLPVAVWLGTNWPEKLLYWWSLSGAACLIELATASKQDRSPDIPDYKED